MIAFKRACQAQCFFVFFLSANSNELNSNTKVALLCHMWWAKT